MAMAVGEVTSVPAYALMLRRYLRLSLRRWLLDLLRAARVTLATYVGHFGIITSPMLLELHVLARLAMTGVAVALIAAVGNIVLGSPFGDEQRRLISGTSNALRGRLR
jgi:hypothetical protein